MHVRCTKFMFRLGFHPILQNMKNSKIWSMCTKHLRQRILSLHRSVYTVGQCAFIRNSQGLFIFITNFILFKETKDLLGWLATLIPKESCLGWLGSLCPYFYDQANTGSQEPASSKLPCNVPDNSKENRKWSSWTTKLGA